MSGKAKSTVGDGIEGRGFAEVCMVQSASGCSYPKCSTPIYQERTNIVMTQAKRIIGIMIVGIYQIR